MDGTRASVFNLFIFLVKIVVFFTFWYTSPTRSQFQHMIYFEFYLFTLNPTSRPGWYSIDFWRNTPDSGYLWTHADGLILYISTTHSLTLNPILKPVRSALLFFSLYSTLAGFLYIFSQIHLEFCVLGHPLFTHRFNCLTHSYCYIRIQTIIIPCPSAWTIVDCARASVLLLIH